MLVFDESKEVLIAGNFIPEEDFSPIVSPIHTEYAEFLKSNRLKETIEGMLDKLWSETKDDSVGYTELEKVIVREEVGSHHTVDVVLYNPHLKTDNKVTDPITLIDLPLVRKDGSIVYNKREYGFIHYYKFEIIEETLEEINIIDNSNPLHVKTIKNVPVEVVTYDFSMDDLKLGNYEIVAVLEHNKIKNSDKNLVYLVDPNTELDHKFNDVPGLCEHCNTKRRRNNTALLRNNDNPNQSLKQIGLTCLKDYTGIEGQDLIRYYMDIRDIQIGCLHRLQ